MDHELTPKLTTARGTVEEWRDLERSYAAAARFKRVYYEQRVASEARFAAEHPEQAENVRRMKERIRAQHPPGTLLAPSPEMPPVWEFDPLIQRVQVLAPEASVTETFRSEGAGLRKLATKTVNPAYWAFEANDPAASFKAVHPSQRHSHDDLDAYCYGPHTREALALLQPNCFLHGWHADWEGHTETSVLGRAADFVALRRIIPLTDPRILGDALNPTVFDESEHAEVVIDRERQVILEWRGLWEGQPYERHVFTDLAFDVPIDETVFYPEPRDRPDSS